MFEWQETALSEAVEAVRAAIVRDWKRMHMHLKEALDALDGQCCNCGKPWRE